MKRILISLIFILLFVDNLFCQSADFLPVKQDLFFNYSQYLRVENLSEEEASCILRGRMNAEAAQNCLVGCIPLPGGTMFGFSGQNRLPDSTKYVIGESIGFALYGVVLFAAFLDWLIHLGHPIPQERVITYAIIGGAGGAVFLSFRIWAVIDLASFPEKQNRMYDRLMGER